MHVLPVIIRNTEVVVSHNNFFFMHVRPAQPDVLGDVGIASPHPKEKQFKIN